MSKFVLIGSGLAGGLLAAYLGRRGYDIDLYERRADPRAGNFVGGRSINLALSTRGIHALEQLGIADEVLRYAIPMRGRMIHDKSGNLHFAPYDRDANKFINSIGRASLNTAVIEAAQRYPNVRVHFNHQCTDVDLDSATAHLIESSLEAEPALSDSRTGVSPADAGRQIIQKGEAVIGVDGAFSAVRGAMQRRIEDFEYSEHYLAHGYKELTIPPGSDGGWRMEKEALHIWPRKSFMMIALPNPDGSFTCTLFWEFEGPRSFATTKTDDHVRRFFDEEFPDAVPLMPRLLEDFKENPTGSLVTIRCAPSDALADLAVDNFIEMRDKTASRTFRAKKKLDHFLEGLLPGIYLPLYTMVTFTRIPYASAARRARAQDWIVFAGLFGAVILLSILLFRVIPG